MPKQLIQTKLTFGASLNRFNLFILLTVGLLCTASSQAQQDLNATISTSTTSKPLRIAVAANFTPVLKVLLSDFTEKTGIKSQLISGASGAMFLQIKHGAPFDIFLSADSDRPKQLEQAGFTLADSRKTYAIGQLALYSSSMTSPTQLSLDQLKSPPKRFAIANPTIAPYGKAAKEALEHLGLWEIYKDRLIKGINIGQTFMQLRSKSVTDGIVAQSQLKLNGLSGVAIPTSYHQPIEQQLVIIKASKNHRLAKKLTNFLLSPASQKLIASYGYVKPMPQSKE
jgi:molybdate transport system substrate-binding protein